MKEKIDGLPKAMKSKNKFIVKYIIFIIILILITAIAIFFTIKYIDKGEVAILVDSYVESEQEKEEVKKTAEDSKYAITSYTETYDTNSMQIKYFYDIDGKITKENQSSEYETYIDFIQIDGLKNTDVQDKINAKLKNAPYKLEKEKNVWTNVTANFSNVLSVEILSDKENQIKTLNFDLTTGEDLEFEKLFVSSAPIKSMIAGGMYEDFAWHILYENYEEYEGFYNMNNADTSEIEEQILLAAKKYDSLKDEIIFSFSPTTVYIHNEEIKTSIEMLDYINEIAIYKRYLTDESIYKDDNLGTKDLIVLTKDLIEYNYNYSKKISYGKISDNIFLEEMLFNWTSEEFKELETLLKYIEKLSKERKALLKQQTSNNKGVIFQGEYHLSKNEDEGYYCIQANYYKAECLISYFEENAFKDYIKMRNADRAELGLNGFAPYIQEDYPEMQISEIEYKTYYISPIGEFLGNTMEEVENKIWE